MTEIAEWDSFYVTIGSAAAALIGLQFIFMSLVASTGRRPGRLAGAAFGTPTIVHFSTVLFLSAVVRAPWKTATPIAIIFGTLGFLGIAYIMFVGSRIRKQKVYEPIMEDWGFYALTPALGYLLLGVSAILTLSHLTEALFGMGAAALILLFVGVRNSWDTASFHVLSKGETNSKRRSRHD